MCLVNTQIKCSKEKLAGRYGDGWRKMSILEYSLALSVGFFLTPVDLGQGEVKRPCDRLIGRLEFQFNGESF